VVSELRDSLDRYPSVIHILTGPRQVGKTTAAQQLIESWPGASVYASADVIPPPGAEWIETHWLRANAAAEANAPCLLVLDEVQKATGWSVTIKRLWDARPKRKPIHVLLLGSSALLLQSSLSESLAGRFYTHDCFHWQYPECREAFGWSLEEWIYFGGYPGAADFRDNEAEWKRYVADSLIEATIARDVLQLQNINKPALLRHLFGLAAAFPAQILSYNKMLGQLQDAGNTTTLAHYLPLLETAYLVSGLKLFSRGQARKRGSSPKLVVWNNALVSALDLRSFNEARADTAWWSRLVENAVLSHILMTILPGTSVTYWRERNAEVDAVIATARQIWGFEVKSGSPGKLAGMAAFKKVYPSSIPLMVGTGGIPLEEFFAFPVSRWLNSTT